LKANRLQINNLRAILYSNRNKNGTVRPSPSLTNSKQLFED